jgi:glycosyltransferase involved in cell wall biosynthesis
MKTFSIIIPTYKKPDSLRLTIESLWKLDYPRNNFEIIIVDNNSSDDTKEVVTELIAKSPVEMRYLLEKKPGLMFAHHAGAKVAKGKILYFTDDDVIVTKSVLKEIEKMFKIDNRIACVTGKILPIWEKEPPEWILKYFNNYMLSVNPNVKEKLLIAPYDVGVFSCHEAIKRAVLFEAGGFNPDYAGNKMLGDGETGLSIKLEKLRYLFAYTDKAIIYNFVPVSRLTQKYMNHRFVVQGRAQSYTDLKKYSKDKIKLGGHIFLYFYKLLLYTLLTVLYLPFSDKWHWMCGSIFYFFARIKYDLEYFLVKKFRKFVLKKNWLV